MRIYLDEDLASAQLTQLLQKAGHDVLTPAATGTLGKSDAVQLACAIRDFLLMAIFKSRFANPQTFVYRL
jgi:hypothetical protein